MAFGLQTFNGVGDVTFDSTRQMLHLGNTLITLPYRVGNHQLETITLPNEVPQWVTLEQLRVVVTPVGWDDPSSNGYILGAFAVTPVSITGRIVKLKRESGMVDYPLPQCTIRFCWISSL